MQIMGPKYEIFGTHQVSGAKIFERSNKKQRSIFLQKDELAWLVRTMEELVAMDNFEVFWDQS